MSNADKEVSKPKQRLAERYRFIEKKLYWDGSVNRTDLKRRFGISMPQATLDLKSYHELAPENLAYDLGRRCYYPSELFNPVFGTPSPQEYLNQLIAENGVESSQLSASQFVEVLPSFRRTVASETLSEILKALRGNERIKIKYQSPRSPESTSRWVYPEKLVYTLGRWQLRAYCHMRHAYRSFVLGRIISVQNRQAESEDIPNDILWDTIVKVEVVPSPALCERARKIVEKDYNMKRGKLVQEVRQALLEYFLLDNKLINNKYGEPGGKRSLITDNGLITISNVTEIQGYLDKL